MAAEALDEVDAQLTALEELAERTRLADLLAWDNYGSKPLEEDIGLARRIDAFVKEAVEARGSGHRPGRVLGSEVLGLRELIHLRLSASADRHPPHDTGFVGSRGTQP